MTDTLTIAFAQSNPTVGAVDKNLSLARDIARRCQKKSVDLVLFPELFISGYPPEDLVLKQAFVEACMEAAEELAAETANGPALLMGTPWLEGDSLFNAMLLLEDGKITAVRCKNDLPNYGVFDEKRVFSAGPLPGPINFHGVPIGVPICEDIWNDEVCETLAETGAEILLVPNGSPFDHNKTDLRLNIVTARVVETGLPMAYLNQIGGQDELVFDGASFCLNADRSLAFQQPAFKEDLLITHWQRQDSGWVCQQGPVAKPLDHLEAVWSACVLGLGDYVRKNHFPGVVLGLSGGIDSAVVAAMAVDALGAEQVHCVMLPFEYTSEESIADADQCAKALGVPYDAVPIADPVAGFNKVLGKMFAGTPEGVTEENIQSRSRGVILMAISNKFGHMVLTTGNKSEMSVGYATLYGDMNGGFNPIKDVYKTQVYDLARWRNQQGGEVIPDRIITKAPSAELRPDQTDQDSLPEYEVLDDILEQLIEHEAGVEDIVSRGHDPKVVERMQHLLYIAEYKRRQAAPGVKITTRSFGKERRYPITNGFRDKTS
ncbi:MAG TPA: NAD+ synthase [Rhizobiales bacterium]|nr:NAD+ synthase [Hyphomicrobiales bacterium]